jgi:hypothetical protein
VLVERRRWLLVRAGGTFFFYFLFVLLIFFIFFIFIFFQWKAWISWYSAFHQHWLPDNAVTNMFPLLLHSDWLRVQRPSITSRSHAQAHMLLYSFCCHHNDRRLVVYVLS